MSADRKWKTGEEIEAIAYKVMAEESSRQHEKLDKILDIVRDGAQASMNTALILHGNEEYGLKGALPDIQERLSASEDKLDIRCAADDEWRSKTNDRLEKLEEGQHRTRRFFAACVRFAVQRKEPEGEDGHKVSGWKIGTLGAGVLAGWNWLHIWLPVIGKKISAAFHAVVK